VQARPVVSGSRRRRRRRRRLAPRGWWTIGAGVLLMGAAVIAVAAKLSGGLGHLGVNVAGFMAGVFQPAVPGGSVVRVQPQEPVSVLVLGSEVAPGYAGPNLTDSMMVLALDPNAHTASLLSVPRDLWVNIPGFHSQRVNTALENTGIAGAELTVEKYVGVPVEYYAIVNYTALVKLVNDVGGINVDVPYKIYDPNFPNAAENKNTLFELPAGMQHMGGKTALKFARERHVFADGDIQRQRDQQLVLYALKSALLQPQNLIKLPQIIGDMENLVHTNLPYADIPHLAEAALHVPSSAIRSGVFDYSSGAVTNYTTSGGADVLLLHQRVAHGIVQNTFGDLLSKMDQMAVQVEDGTPAQQAGAYFTGVLQNMGVQTLPWIPAAQTSLKNNHVYVNTAVVHLARSAALPTEAVILGQMLGAQAQTRRIPGSRAQVVVELGNAFPSVLGLTPTSGPSAGGTTVKITGTNLSGVQAVDFGDQTGTNLHLSSDGTSLTVIAPQGTGSVPVVLVTPSAKINVHSYTYS